MRLQELIKQYEKSELPNEKSFLLVEKLLIERDKMTINIGDLSKGHELVKAGKRMVLAHNDHESLLPALDDISEEFPNISYQLLVAVWIGVNCKDIEIKSSSI